MPVVVVCAFPLPKGHRGVDTSGFSVLSLMDVGLFSVSAFIHNAAMTYSRVLW